MLTTIREIARTTVETCAFRASEHYVLAWSLPWLHGRAMPDPGRLLRSAAWCAATVGAVAVSAAVGNARRTAGP